MHLAHFPGLRSHNLQCLLPLLSLLSAAAPHSEQRGAAVGTCDRIQPGQPVAAAGAAEGNQNVVVDQFATTVGEDLCRLVKHSRYYWLLLAESHLTRRLFGSMLRRMEARPAPAE